MAQRQCAGSAMTRLVGVFWPLRRLFSAWELRRLMRQMPTTPRLWVPTPRGIRPEPDAEYLARLRERAQEKAARASARKRGATAAAWVDVPRWRPARLTHPSGADLDRANLSDASHLTQAQLDQRRTRTAFPGSRADQPAPFFALRNARPLLTPSCLETAPAHHDTPSSSPCCASRSSPEVLQGITLDRA